MSDSGVRGSNRLLDALPAGSRQALAGRLEFVRLAPKHFLHRHGERLRYAYFPSTGMLSLTMLAGSKSVEVAMVGDEGMFGLPLLFGSQKCPMAAISHVGGEVARLEAHAARDHFVNDPAFAALLGRYAQAFMAGLGQGVVCTKMHRIEQRCARWLLMAQDRLHADEFAMTQDALARTLSVRRPSVSEAAEQLQQRGLIRYRLGRVEILNRPGLEKAACECYRAMRKELARIFV